MYINNEFTTNLSSLQGLRVIVVDENVDFCNLITLVLQLYGVEVQKVFSAKFALEIFKQWQPDVLISDIALLNENGYDLIQKVRTKEGEKGEVVLAIAMTNDANEKMAQQTLDAGFDLWFTKPLDFNAFLAVLSCLKICQQSSYTIAQRILDHVPRDSDLSLSQQHISSLLIN